MTVGYSGTPLAKKLGIKYNFNVSILNSPNHYDRLFSDWPEHVKHVDEPTHESLDFIHVFCKEDDDLKHAANQIPHLKKSGMLWVSWPKGKSKIESSLNRDVIREYFLNAGLVDVKVAAIDEDWSGLKFVYRLKDR